MCTGVNNEVHLPGVMMTSSHYIPQPYGVSLRPEIIEHPPQGPLLNIHASHPLAQISHQQGPYVDGDQLGSSVHNVAPINQSLHGATPPPPSSVMSPDATDLKLASSGIKHKYVHQYQRTDQSPSSSLTNGHQSSTLAANSNHLVPMLSTESQLVLSASAAANGSEPSAENSESKSTVCKEDEGPQESFHRTGDQQSTNCGEQSLNCSDQKLKAELM